MKTYQAVGQFVIEGSFKDSSIIQRAVLKALKAGGFKEVNLELTIERLTKKGQEALDKPLDKKKAKKTSKKVGKWKKH
jgi:hypothetical protein